MGLAMENALLQRQKKQQKKSRWRAAVRGMAVVVVFCTTYALILPAITMTAHCGLPEHEHTAACYANDDTLQWNCLGDEAETPVHEHSEDCYDEHGILRCGYADFVLHTHDETMCYDAEHNLICPLPEITSYTGTALYRQEGSTDVPEEPQIVESAEGSEDGEIQEAEAEPIEDSEESVFQYTVFTKGDESLPEDLLSEDSDLFWGDAMEWTEPHTHSEDCYDDEGRLTCGQLEIVQHVHTKDCLQGTLICGLEEHQHTEECYRENGEYLCGLEAHQHNETCYDAEGTLTCILPEHVHTEACKATADKDADDPGGDVVDPNDPDATEPTTPGDLCGLEEHQHTDLCYTPDGTLICSKTEHSHTEACLEAAPVEHKTLITTVEDATIQVQYPKDALPEAVSLQATEISPEEDAYDTYAAQALETLQAKSEREEALVLSSARFFDITFLLDGKEIEPTKPVDVTITYANQLYLQDEEQSNAVHFAADGPEVLPMETDGSGEATNTFAFTQDSFSVTGILVTAYEAQTVAAATGESKVAKYLTNDAANKWQIVDQGYKGNTKENKIKSNDGMVRIQKNVIPTDEENEFLVYLSVDVNNAYQKYFETLTYRATSSANFHGQEGNIINKEDMTGNKGVNISATAEYERWGYFNIYVTDGKEKKLLAQNIKLYWDQANQITIFAEIGEKYLILAAKVKDGGVNGKTRDVTLDDDAKIIIKEQISTAAILETVTDAMGDYISYIDVVDGDYAEEPSYTSDTGTLTWKPKIREGIEVTEETASDGTTVLWSLNATELVYKVRLMTEKAGFQSAAADVAEGKDSASDKSYAVNKQATLTYKNEKNQDQTIDFQIPYVRGVRYNATVKKVDADDDTKWLEGATFTIAGANGEDSVCGDKTVTTAENGEAKFTDLIGKDGKFSGNFTLTETEAPKGYQKGTKSSELSIGNYTNTENKEIFTVDGSNFLYQPAEEFKIANDKIKEIPIVLQKVDATDSKKSLSGAVFDLYAQDEDGNRTGKPLYTGLRSDSEGIFSPDNFKLPVGIYQLIETEAPDGYLLLEAPIILCVTENGVAAYKGTVALTVTQNSSNSGSEETVYTVQVTNSNGTKLPETGGIGTARYRMLGVGLMTIALLLEGQRKFRRRRDALLFHNN